VRISRSGELQGLDLHEHGTLAYPVMVMHHVDGAQAVMTGIGLSY